MEVKLKSKFVRKFLIRKNKSLSWLYYKLEISSPYLSQLLNGSRNPSPKLRERIMKKLPEHKFDDLFEIKEIN